MAKTKKKKNKRLLRLIDNNCHGFPYSSGDRVHLCGTYDEGDCWPCHNYTYEDLEITDEPDLESILSYVCYDINKDNKNNHDILRYCVDRVVRLYKLYDVNVYEAVHVRGYYGGEVETELDSSVMEKVNDALTKLETMNDTERVNFVLELEYGYLLDPLKDVTWVIQSIDPNKVIIGNDEYYRKLPPDTKDIYNDTRGLPIGVYKRGPKDTFRIVDGYHRYMSFRDKQMVRVIVNE